MGVLMKVKKLLGIIFLMLVALLGIIFFVNKSLSFPMILAIILVFLSSSLALLFSYKKGDSKIEVSLANNGVCSGFCVLMSLAMLGIGIYDLILSIANKLGTLYIILAVLAMLSAIVLFFMSRYHASGENIYELHPVFILFPTLWAFVRLVVVFNQFSTVSLVRINPVYFIAVISLLLFFFEEAKILVPVNRLYYPFNKLVVYGIFSVVFVLSYSIPSIIYSFIEYSYSYTPIAWTTCIMDISIALYIISVLIDTWNRIKNQQISEASEEETNDIQTESNSTSI